MRYSLLLAFTLSLFLCSVVGVQARAFTNKAGKTINAELLDIKGEKVQLKVGRKTFLVPIVSLSEADQAYIENWEMEKQAELAAKAALTQKISNHGISTEPGQSVYKSPKGEYDDGKYVIYVPQSYDGTKAVPLIISGHGANQTGEREMVKWPKFSDAHGIIVVCPSYASSQSGLEIAGKESQAVMKDILMKVHDAFHIDKSKVMHTGYSGGGYATWYAMNFHEEFTHLCFRCANYYLTVPGQLKSYRKWKGHPVYWFWGENDHPTVLGEIDNALEFLTKKVKCDLKQEKIPGHGHADNVDTISRAVEWFMATDAVAD
jgi:predicted peptidase